MNGLLKHNYLFFAGDAAKMIGVHRSTINRWLRDNKIEGKQMQNGHWLITLNGINQGRQMYGLRELTPEDAYLYYDTGEPDDTLDWQ